jgi:hypothetical protein
MDIRELTLQLEMLTMSITDAKEIDRIDAYLSSVEKVSIDRYVAIYELTGSDNLRLVLLSRIKRIFESSPRLITPLLIDSLWRYFVENVTVMNNGKLLKIYIYILALSFVNFSKELDIYQKTKEYLGALKSRSLGDSECFLSLLIAQIVFFQDVIDYVIVIFRNSEDFVKFKAAASFFKIHALNHCIEMIIPLIETSGSLLLNCTPSASVFQVNEYYQVALNTYVKLINLDNCVQKGLDIHGDGYFGIGSSNLASITPLKSYKFSRDWNLIRNADFMQYTYAVLTCGYVRSSDNVKDILESCLKIYHTAASLSLNVFESPDERSRLMLVIYKLLVGVMKDQQFVRILRSPGQSFGFVMILSILIKTFLFDSFKIVYSENSQLLAGLLCESTAIMKETLIADDQLSLSSTVVSDFIYFLYNVMLISTELFMEIIKENDCNLFQFLFENSIKRTRRLIDLESSFASVKDELSTIGSALTSLILASRNPFFLTIFDALVSSNDESQIVLFLVVYCKLLDNVPNQHLLDPSDQNFKLMVMCSDHIFRLFMMFSQVQDLSSSKMVTLHFLVNLTFDGFFKKFFKSNTFKAEAFLNSIAFMRESPVNFMKLYIQIFVNSSMISKRVFNEELIGINIDSFNKIFEFVMIGKSNSIAIYMMTIPPSELNMFSGLLMDHNNNCNREIFISSHRNCRLYYECITRLFCTLFNKNYGCDNPDQYFIGYLTPVLNVMQNDFEFFVYIFKGIALGLKGGFKELFHNSLVRDFLTNFESYVTKHTAKSIKVLICALKSQKECSDNAESKNNMRILFSKCIVKVSEILYNGFAHLSLTTLSSNEFREQFSKPAMKFVGILKAFIEAFSVSQNDLCDLWALFERIVLDQMQPMVIGLYLSEFGDTFYFIQTILCQQKIFLKVMIRSNYYTKLLSILFEGLETISCGIYKSILDFHIDSIISYALKECEECLTIKACYASGNYSFLVVKKIFTDLLCHEKSWSSKIIEALYYFHLLDPVFLKSLATELIVYSKEIEALSSSFSRIQQTGNTKIKPSQVEMIKKEFNID